MKRVYCEWYDAWSYDAWNKKSDAKISCNKKVIIKTYGWLMKIGKKYIGICHSRLKNKKVQGAIYIPRNSIKKLKIFSK